MLELGRYVVKPIIIIIISVEKHPLLNIDLPQISQAGNEPSAPIIRFKRLSLQQ